MFDTTHMHTVARLQLLPVMTMIAMTMRLLHIAEFSDPQHFSVVGEHLSRHAKYKFSLLDFFHTWIKKCIASYRPDMFKESDGGVSKNF